MSETTTFSESAVDPSQLQDTNPRTPENFTYPSFGMNGIIALVVSIVLMALSALFGFSFWIDWFSSIDRIVCTLFAFLGLGIALIRSNWVIDAPPRRLSPLLLWSLASAILLISLVTGRPKLAGISMGLAAAGWFAAQMRGESLANAIALGMAFMIPSFVDACKARGIFESSERVAIQITSGLADSLQECNLVVGNTIKFGHGEANNFSCEGTWDGIVTFIGISLFCIYAFRRTLVQGLITLSMSFVVWMGLRGAAWVTLSYLASLNGHWYEWTFTLDLFLFVVGTLFIISLDQFFGTLLQPIPMEFINPDFPLIASSWNWIVGLPQLTTPVPKREFQVDKVEEEELI